MKEQTVPTKTDTQTQPQVPETREEERTLIPPVDIFEIEEGLAVIVDLPGVAKDAVDVHVENDVLTIKGTPRTDGAGESTYREFDLVPYYRQFQLGEQVDQEKIRAEMKYGVLTIHLPKAEKAKPKKISVNVGS